MDSADNTNSGYRTRFERLAGALSHFSVIVLILANLVPIYGVLFWGWQVFPLLFLYWLENVFLGVLNVLKMLVCKPDDEKTWLGKIFIIPFFCIHYGIFTLVHGIFVFAIFSGISGDGMGFPDIGSIVQVTQQYNLGWAILDLALSHVISFGYNFIRGGEYKRKNPGEIMIQPYGRVIAMHLTILGGAFLMALMNSPVAGLIVLVVMKIILDVRAHVNEHFKKPREEILLK
jgi:hypothetical protein